MKCVSMVWAAMTSFASWFDSAGMGLSPAEGSERGRCQCKSTPVLMLLSSLIHIFFMIILTFGPSCLSTWWWTPFFDIIRCVTFLVVCRISPELHNLWSKKLARVRSWVSLFGVLISCTQFILMLPASYQCEALSFFYEPFQLMTCTDIQVVWWWLIIYSC